MLKIFIMPKLMKNEYRKLHFGNSSRSRSVQVDPELFFFRISPEIGRKTEICRLRCETYPLGESANVDLNLFVFSPKEKPLNQNLAKTEI